MQLLGDRSGAHVGLKNRLWRAHHKARLFCRLTTNAVVSIVTVQQARAGLDQHAVRIAIHVRRKAKLPRQQQRRSRYVIEQQHRAVAPVIGLAVLLLPTAVVALIVKRRFTQHERAADTSVLASAEKLLAASPFQIISLNESSLPVVPAHIDDKTLRALTVGGVSVKKVQGLLI